MKKLLSLLFVLLFIPGFVFADVYGPVIEPYVAQVSNPEGASFYGYDLDQDGYVKSTTSLEYGTKVAVYDEFDMYAVIENYDEFLLLSDIQKIDQSYEDYKNEIGEGDDITPIIKPNGSNNTHKTLKVCIISAVIVVICAVVVILLVNKKKGEKENA